MEAARCSGTTMQVIAGEYEVNRARVQQILSRWGIEGTDHRRRRQSALGRLTPIEFEMIDTAALAAKNEPTKPSADPRLRHEQRTRNYRDADLAAGTKTKDTIIFFAPSASTLPPPLPTLTQRSFEAEVPGRRSGGRGIAPARTWPRGRRRAAHRGGRPSTSGATARSERRRRARRTGWGGSARGRS